MSKQLWNYLRSRVQVVNSDGEVIKGLVTDFIDEMDNDEQDEITILIDNPSPDEPTEISLFESEIILPKGSKYDIINMKRKGDNVIIEMNLREE